VSEDRREAVRTALESNFTALFKEVAEKISQQRMEKILEAVVEKKRRELSNGIQTQPSGQLLQ